MVGTKRDNDKEHTTASNGGKKKARRLRRQSDEEKLIAESRRSIEMCAKSGDAIGALTTLQHLKNKNVEAPAYLYRVTLNVCSQSSKLESLVDGLFDLFKEMESIPAQKLIDENTLTAMIRICAQSKHFDRCAQLFDKMEIYDIKPKLRTFASLLCAYAASGNLKKALDIKLMIEQNGIKMTENEYVALLDGCSVESEHVLFPTLLDEFANNIMIPSRSTWANIRQWYNSGAACVNGKKWECRIINVDGNGHCSLTKNCLKSIDLTVEEKQELLDKIEALIGMEEKKIAQWNDFKEWHQQHGPYDVIVDAANVAYYNQNFDGGGFDYKQIKHVVERYQQRGKKVLVVLHKRHMSADRIPEAYAPILKDWLSSQTMYNCLPGNNDDWYWLYAAVQGRDGAYLVSNDEMRDHHFQMIQNETFGLWKERHQSQVIADADRVYTHTTYQEQLRRSHMSRGRWSVPGFEGSVDLDTLVDAPSPPARKGTLRVSQDDSLVQETTKTTLESLNRFGDRNLPRDSITRDKGNGSFFGRKKKNRRGVSKRSNSKNLQRQYLFDFQLENCDHGLHRNDSVEILDFDSDLILGSPPDSPSVIHARWGEPVEDPEQMNTCMDFVPNPFKLGFCVNCQKQHDVTSTGDVVFTKEFKKICRPTVSKTAANALDNPAALNSMLLDNQRESDVDLALILRQRRDILLRLKRIEQDRKVSKPTSKRAQSRSMYVRESNESSTKLRMLASSREHDTGAEITPESSIATRTTASRSFCAAKVMRKQDGRLDSVWL